MELVFFGRLRSFDHIYCNNIYCNNLTQLSNVERNTQLQQMTPFLIYQLPIDRKIEQKINYAFTVFGII